MAAGGAARDRIRVFAADFSDVRELPTEIAIDRLAAHPDGNYFLSWGDDSVVRLWDASTGDQTVLVETGGSNANVVAIAASGRWLAAGRYDSVLELWDLG